MLTNDSLTWSTYQLYYGGEAVDETVTDAHGLFAFRAPPAPYQVTAQRAGFDVASLDIMLSSRGAHARVIMSSLLEPGQARMVLSWSTHPADLDLDLHVVTPLRTAHGQCRIGASVNGHVADTCGRRMPRARGRSDEDFVYGERTQHSEGEGGPESVTFSRLLSGVYQVYVHAGNREEAQVSTSEAHLQIYLPAQGANAVRDFKVARQQGVQGYGRALRAEEGGGFRFQAVQPGDTRKADTWWAATLKVVGGHVAVLDPAAQTHNV